MQTATRNTEHCIRLQAVSIMNVIVMKSNAFMEREKFGRTLAFEMIAELLAKETGFEVRRQAVQLLYMLLNCPKILVKLCTSYEEVKDAGAMDENADGLTFQKYHMIFQGLADCLAYRGHCLEELTLCRNVVLLMAFLASSGKSGFEILASHKLHQDANFLILILQVLAAQVDQTAVNTKQQQQLYKERTLLIRETLILLNRLVSNSSYSATVLQVLLTSSRYMASLAINVASRLSRKDQIYEKFDGRPESDIGDLARVFKKRVFSYLGDNIS